ncbi:hypothetical protein QE152_g19809 [Popillia japonica]|uniref:Uncharacterized protein n=1 Tax=Popillia japonica TaxID=7064 RepID=A0AAW1KQ57_POPJA
MVCKWLLFNARIHLTQVEIVFPIVGHYIATDRMFGNIEKVVKKISKGKNLNAYYKYYKRTRHSFKNGRRLQCSRLANVIKSPASWHFKFQPAKRCILTKGADGGILVSGAPFYCNHIGIGKGIWKKGEHLELMVPKELELGVSLKTDIIKSISSLLASHYGSAWKEDESLCYLTTLFENNDK